MKKIILTLSLFITIVSCNNYAASEKKNKDTTKDSLMNAFNLSVNLKKEKLMEVQLEDSLSTQQDLAAPIKYHLDSLILTAFNQGPNVDCASIAFIKCSMATFGPDNVFKSISKNGKKYSIVLRNLDTIHMDSLEVSIAEHASDFQLLGDSTIWKKAKFIFAVMSKSATQIAERDHLSIFYSQLHSAKFEDILKVVHGEIWGIDARQFPVTLGFISESISWKDKGYENAFIFENGYHAVFGECGCFDNYGKEWVLNTKNFLSHMSLKNPVGSLEKILFVIKDQVSVIE